MSRNASEDILSVRGRAIGTPSRSRGDLSNHEENDQVGMVPHSLSIKQNKKGIHERPPWKPTNKATRDGADLND